MSISPDVQRCLETATKPAGSEMPHPSYRTLASANLLRPFLFHMILRERLDTAPLAPEISASLLTKFRQSNSIQNKEMEQQFIQKFGWNDDDYLWQVELPHRIASYCAEHFLAKAEARFLDRKDQLDQVVYSLLRVRDASLARELHLRIVEGESNFAELAEQFSEGHEKSTRGMIGPVSLSQGHPQLIQRLRSAQSGELIPPFSVENFWLVAKVERHEPAILDEPMRQRMAQELFDEWIQEEISSRITSLTTAPAEAAQ